MATMPSRVADRPIGFRPAEISALVNAPVVKTHASEVAFLATLRSKAADSAPLPPQTPAEARLTRRRTSGRPPPRRDSAWAAAQEALADVEEDSLFAAAFLAFESGEPRRMNHVMQLALTHPALESAL